MKIVQRVKERLRGYWGYLIVFVSILLLFSLLKNLTKISEIKKSIQKEEGKLEKLKKENERLKRQALEVESAEFIERQLRDKLGLARKGEIVLVLPDEETLRKLAPEIPEEEETLPEPNWKKWLKLFF